jgi:hypothetical protein
MAGRDYGGRMSINGSTGYRMSPRGTINVSAAHSSVEAITNQDGNVDRVITPAAPTAEVVFVDDGHDFDALLNADRHNITIVEEKTNVTHLFTRAFWTGRPASNRLNGEVTALGIVAEIYSRIG